MALPNCNWQGAWMTSIGRFVMVVLLIAGTYVFAWFGSLAIDPAIGLWGLFGPLLFATAGGLLAIPTYRVSSPVRQPVRWVVVAFQLALPFYVLFAAVHFFIVMKS